MCCLASQMGCTSWSKNDTLWGARQVVSSQEAANVTLAAHRVSFCPYPGSVSHHPFHAARSNVLQPDPLEILAVAAKSVGLSKVSRVSCAFCLLTEERCKLKWVWYWKSTDKAWTWAWRKRTSGPDAVLESLRRRLHSKHRFQQRGTLPGCDQDPHLSVSASYLCLSWCERHTTPAGCAMGMDFICFS